MKRRDLPGNPRAAAATDMRIIALTGAHGQIKIKLIRSREVRTEMEERLNG